MGVIRSLVVNLSARTVDFSAGMNSAGKSLRRLMSDVGSASLKIAKFGAAMGVAAGAAAVGGLTLLAKSSADAIDSTAKVADRLGVTTEALVGLRHGADLAGVGAEQFDGALTKMVRGIGEATVKGGPVADTLSAIGLSAEDMARVSPDQQFLRIADAMQNLTNPTERVNVAMQLFGKQGAAMINVMGGGSEAIKAMMADAEALGLTFSRVDAAKVEAANDALSRMWKIFEGLGNQIIIQLAPFIEVAANKLTDMGAKGLNGGQTVIRVFEWIASAVAKTADFLSLFTAGWEALKATVLLVTAGVVKAIDWVGGGIVKLLNLIPGVELEWTDTFSTLIDTLVDDAVKAAGRMDEAMSRFHNGERQQQVKAFFDSIRAEADKSAQSVLTKAGQDSQFADAMAKIEAQKKADKARQAELKKAAEKRARDEEALKKKVAETEAANDPAAKLKQRYAELQKLYAGGLSHGSYTKELRKALDEYRQAMSGESSHEAGTTGRLAAMGVEYFQSPSQQSDTDLLRQINNTLTRIEHQGGVGTLSMN